MRILLAEDDWTSRQVLLRALVRWGHDVTVAEDGAEALRAHLADPFPLILTDWIMPKMTGIELCAAVRELNRPEYTYIIILTARGDQASLIEAFDAGVDDFLPKPFDPAELLARMRGGERVLTLEGQLLRRMDELRRTNERMQRDLEAAADIQQGLLPERQLESPEVHFAWMLNPCEELAGDIFNFIQINDRHVGVYLLDVSGHGVGAALLSVTVSRLLAPSHEKSIVTSLHPETGEEGPAAPHEVLERLNNRFQLTDSPAHQFFTILYGVLDLETGVFTFSNAGHPPGVVIPSASDKPVLLESRNLPIGFMPDVEYSEECLRLDPGDRVFVFSDGIVEAMDNQGELFESQRVEEVLSAKKNEPLESIVEGLVHSVEDWANGKREDDISVLAFEWRGA